MRCPIAFLLIQVLPLAAQPVIDSDHAPAIGDAFTMHQGMYVNIPLTGADQVWDYSSITAAGILQYQFLPIDLADTADFPAAQMMLEFPGAEFFYSVGTNGFFDHGTNDQLGQVQFSDPKQTLEYPLAYGGTWNDQFSGVAGEATIDGTNECIVNGHGTLILPWGSVPGALRTRCVTTTTHEGFSTMLTSDTIVMFHHQNAMQKIVSIEIIDLHGRTCSSMIITDDRTVIDLDQFGNELYLTKARFANGAERTIKFIVQH